jgi:hypothetical protein
MLSKIFCAISYLLFVFSAFATTKDHFVVKLENGMVCGYLDIVYTNKKNLTVDYSCFENGRGDQVNEIIRLTQTHRIEAYKATGKSEMGAAISEQFSMNNKIARWQSASENKQTYISGDPFYLPVNATLSVNALMIAALSKSPNNELPLLPSGNAKLKKLTEQVFVIGEKTIRLQLVALEGIGLNPEFFWLTAGQNPKLFFHIEQGYSVYKDGYAPLLPTLKEIQNHSQDKILQDRAKLLQHPIEGIVLIKNVQIFNSILGKLEGPKNVYIHKGKILQISNT